MNWMTKPRPGLTPTGAAPVLETLVFALGEKEYGIDLQKVVELRSANAVTCLRNAPDHIIGTTERLGRAVPVVDLRSVLQLGSQRDNRQADVILVNLDDSIVGIVVDDIVDVVTLEAKQIQPAVASAAALNVDALIGAGLVGDRLLTLIDIDGLMSAEDMAMIVKLAA